MKRLEIKYINIKDIKPYKKNPRKNEQAIPYVTESIKQFGFKNPIIIDKNNIIICGHTRYRSAEQLGLKEIPCVYADDLTDEQVKAFRIADNKVSEKATWDFDLLNDELSEILDIDMDLLGFDDNIELEEEKKEIVEDEIPEPPKVAKTKMGDIWQLGEHRLMCGDSTKKENFEKLMNDKKADLVFTDPPYGVGFENVGVLNDNQNENELIEFNKKWIKVMFDNIKDNGSFYIWGTERSLMNIYAFILYDVEQKEKIIMRSLITWDKGLGQYQNAEYMRRYPVASEKCLFYMCGIQGFNNNADNYYEGWEPIRTYLDNERKKSGLTTKTINQLCGKKNMTQSAFTKGGFRLILEEDYKKIQDYCIKNNINAFSVEYEEIKKQYEEIKKQWYETRAYFDNTHDNMNDVWHFAKTSNKERELTGDHATPKPIALCSRAIKSSSRENEIVLDVFGGSGSTLIACEQLNRKCYMMELDPIYCDVIITRWETLTGKKAKLIKE